MMAPGRQCKFHALPAKFLLIHTIHALYVYGHANTHFLVRS